MLSSALHSLVITASLFLSATFLHAVLGFNSQQASEGCSLVREVPKDKRGPPTFFSRVSAVILRRVRHLNVGKDLQNIS